MISVRTLIGLTIALFAALSLSGCTSDGGSSSNSIRPYLGAWSGTIVNTPAGSSQQETGTAQISVNNSGEVSGILQNTTTGDTGAISGVLTLEDDRVLVNGTIAYTASNVYQLAGSLAIQPNNHLTGTIHSYNAQRQLQSSTAVDLTRP